MKKTREVSYSDLLAKVAKGEERAFSELYNLFYPSLLRHILLKIQDESVAEDILHDLFLSLWNSRERIQKVESLPAYLYTACRYLIFEYLKRTSTVHTDFSDLELDSKEEPLEERLYYRYLLNIVNKEIENLPARCREVFKLSRKQHKSTKEIAEYLSISESTVENQIREALKRLKIATKHYRYILFY